MNTDANASSILNASRQIRSSTTMMANRLQALVEHIGSADFDPHAYEDDNPSGLIQELDAVADETKSELTRGSKALDMLFDLFPGATDPAVADEEDEDEEEVEGSYAARLKRARVTLRAEDTSVPASGKRPRRARG